MKNVIIRNQKLFCSNCGTEEAINLPTEIDEFINKGDEFSKVHEKCEKTWDEPETDQTKSEQYRALWWIANGEHGRSSKAMWNHFMGMKVLPHYHPLDPDDFSRCYKLLQAIPEWKKRIPELEKLSPEWKNLAENWDKLTEMFEQNERENWENSNEIGMYKFMKELINLK